MKRYSSRQKQFVFIDVYKRQGWYSLMSDLFPDYFPVKQNGRWGLMETQSRRLVIPFRYEAVDVPIGERFPAKEGRWGVVDLMGRIQLPFLYDSVQLNSCVDGKTGSPRLADCSVALRNGCLLYT